MKILWKFHGIFFMKSPWWISVRVSACCEVYHAAPSYLGVAQRCLRLLFEVISVLHHCNTSLQNNEIRTKKFRCFWSDPVEHTAANHAWPITDTDSVLCTLEDCCSTVLMKHYYSASVTVYAVRIVAETQMYLLTYLLASRRFVESIGVDCLYCFTPRPRIMCLRGHPRSLKRWIC